MNKLEETCEFFFSFFLKGGGKETYCFHAIENLCYFLYDSIGLQPKLIQNDNVKAKRVYQGDCPLRVQVQPFKASA